MKKADLNDLYKEFYFHELDVREKVTNRLQLTFAFHATVLTIIAYMMKTLDTEASSNLVLVFYGAMILTVAILARSIFFTVQAFWGNTYTAVASPNKIESFRKSALEHEEKIKKYNSELGDKDRVAYSADDALSDYLYDEYAKCTSHNIEVNFNRGVWLHKAIKYLLITAVPLVIGSGVFVVGDMDGSSPRKEVLIKHSAPLKVETSLGGVESILHEIKESCMIDNEQNQGQGHGQGTSQPTPPPAPEPPEPRNIIESDQPPVSLDRDS
ncbi:hypothetical protein [Neptuniibacter caesariensis]|uniref:Uncharacterized protein n=1 Tax=Neptuniibacter caesariensis TaxID=207954 RepID=A0A7U8C9U2_NEPCE|nr:hypothetical protein [Neptuniibacter caesariensis]EAR62799.1 hypothetical protein MED92_06766 [Oceanospirillum sp. MED92] [Neptuniibacter caesariensis]